MVLLSSDVADQVRPFVAGYATSKWGLEGMARSMRYELEGTGVRLSVVRPGPTLTEMGMDWDAEATEMVLDQWVRLGLARSSYFLKARSIADAVHHVATAAPRRPHPLPRGPARGAARSADRRRRGPDRPAGEPMTATETATGLPPEVSRLNPDDPHGHLQELRTDPIGLLHRVRDECGDVGRFQLAQHTVVLVSGAEPNEVFFRAPDEVLDQAAAYPFMTPIFGKGVVFDASPERRKEMLKNQALRGDMMKGHAATIEHEIRRMVDQWDDEGEIDLLDWFAELTIYTTSACLIGKRFREELDGSFAALYHDLEQGTDALAYVDAYADIESFRRRDAARVGPGRAGAGDHRQARARSPCRRRRTATSSTS